MLQAARRAPTVRKLSLELLEERLAPATRVWSGGGADANWSTDANWGATGVPALGDDLQFPATAFTTSNNNIPGLFLGTVAFTTGTGYVLTGLPVSVFTAIAAATGTNRISFEVQIPSDVTVTIDVAAGATLTIDGVVSGFGPVNKIGAGTLV